MVLHEEVIRLYEIWIDCKDPDLKCEIGYALLEIREMAERNVLKYRHILKQESREQ